MSGIIVSVHPPLAVTAATNVPLHFSFLSRMVSFRSFWSSPCSATRWNSLLVCSTLQVSGHLRNGFRRPFTCLGVHVKEKGRSLGCRTHFCGLDESLRPIPCKCLVVPAAARCDLSLGSGRALVLVNPLVIVIDTELFFSRMANVSFARTLVTLAIFGLRHL